MNYWGLAIDGVILKNVLYCQVHYWRVGSANIHVVLRLLSTTSGRVFDPHQLAGYETERASHGVAVVPTDSVLALHSCSLL